MSIDRAFATAGGSAWTPYLSLDGVRELDGRNDYIVDGVFTGSTSTRGTSVRAEAGLGMKAGNLSAPAGANWQDGGALKDFAGGPLQIGHAW